jgi:hypothetical protein
VAGTVAEREGAGDKPQTKAHDTRDLRNAVWKFIMLRDCFLDPADPHKSSTARLTDAGVTEYTAKSDCPPVNIPRGGIKRGVGGPGGEPRRI